MFQLRRRGCDAGNCPVYGVAIYSDREVVFEGGANVAAVGQRKSTLPTPSLGALVDAFQRANFINTPMHCCDCPDAPDARGTSRVVIDYRPGSVEKEILFDERCPKQPEEIRRLVEEIERLTVLEPWIAAPPRPAASRPLN
jgi:hypothetical protein